MRSQAAKVIALSDRLQPKPEPPDLKRVFEAAELHPLGEAPKPGSILMISDLHFDCLSAAKARALAAVIRWAFAEASEVIIVGDIGDAVDQPDTQRFMERLSGGVLRALAWHDAHGRTPLYIPGNHDAAFRRNEINWPALKVRSTVAEAPVRLLRMGRKMLLSHGDEFDTDEHNPAIQWLHHTLNGSKTLRLGRNAFNPLLRYARFALYEMDYFFWGQVGLMADVVGIADHKLAHVLHRRASWARKGPGAFVHNLHDFEDAAAEVARRERPDLLVMGHTHVPILERLESTIHLNTGDWMEHAVVSWMDEEGVYQQDLSCETAPGMLHFL